MTTPHESYLVTPALAALIKRTMQLSEENIRLVEENLKLTDMLLKALQAMRHADDAALAILIAAEIVEYVETKLKMPLPNADV
jgi:hypothetical protein